VAKLEPARMVASRPKPMVTSWGKAALDLTQRTALGIDQRCAGHGVEDALLHGLGLITRGWAGSRCAL